MKFIYSCLVLAIISLHCGYSLQAVPLGSYGADANLVSVSGISAGAAMAVQFHVTYSSELMGMGSVAGMPYFCAQNSYPKTTTCMYEPNLINVNELIDVTDSTAAANYIDQTSNMDGDKVYIFAGTLDTVVRPASGKSCILGRTPSLLMAYVRKSALWLEKYFPFRICQIDFRTVLIGNITQFYVLTANGKNIEEYYTHYASNILTEFGVAAEHCQPTVDYGNNCAFLMSPYISKCDYNAAYIMLNHFYGDLIEPTGSVPLTGDFFEFDQSEFITGNPGDISMDTIGYAYVPAFCQTNRGCRFHIALHGCSQGRVFVDDKYAMNGGYNEVAELNNIIVIYPQADKILLTNPNGCFDWWGYTDDFYATNVGVQMVAIHNMMKKVLL